MGTSDEVSPQHKEMGMLVEQGTAPEKSLFQNKAFLPADSDPEVHDVINGTMAQKGHELVTSISTSAPLRKVITKEVKFSVKGSGRVDLDDTGALVGYTKRYFRNEITGRPNQVFVCSTCGAQRPKISKITKHLNVHKKNKKRTPAQSKTQPKPIIKLPTMDSFLSSAMLEKKQKQ